LTRGIEMNEIVVLAGLIVATGIFLFMKQLHTEYLWLQSIGGFGSLYDDEDI